MDRTPPAAGSEEIELYIRTIYSLLRSSGPIRLRSLEETHLGTRSSLHFQADSPNIDVAALIYSAMRLPPEFPTVSLVVLGQMETVFRRRGYRDVENWPRVRARARRRKMFLNEEGTLAAFISSVSDIDDLVPTMVTYQIEWNKIHGLLNRYASHWAGDSYPEGDFLDEVESSLTNEQLEQVQGVLNLSAEDFLLLRQAWPGRQLISNLRRAARRQMDVEVVVLGSGLSDYRRSVQLWWHTLTKNAPPDMDERPMYFISSNVHSFSNLLSGYIWQREREIVQYVLEHRPEELYDEYHRLQEEHRDQFGNFLYYAARLYVGADESGSRAEEQGAHEAAAGIVRISNPHCLDVEAQLIEVAELEPELFDPRLGQFNEEEIALLHQSDALIFNIDYPLGMAAYHVFSQVSTSAPDLQGVYILGKAATLNGRVGDVMIPNVVYDEHSRNTFLFRNCFTAQDVAPYLNYGTVFDNQKSVTVRGTFLQNRDFMHVFYEEGYTDIEMEAGPYLSAIYEDIYPKRHPLNEIVNIYINAPYEIGILHYASDTPISRRESLLSKSMSYFGVDATYATSIPILQRILHREIDRLSDQFKVRTSHVQTALERS